ncbi:MAG: NAD(+)/NADH kinase [Dehalococcoidia bacterium]|nr:NAD(+)/NADH kinase [Dehalococcoidia bacterium]
MLKAAAILHHPQSEGALVFARRMADGFRSEGIDVRLCDVWHADAPAAVDGVGLIVCVGGDGSVLRAARLAMLSGTPLLGVNMGRLGFLTDVGPDEVQQHLHDIHRESWRIEERVMVQATVDGDTAGVHHGLNDIVVSRRLAGRPIYVEVVIDGARMAIYRCDGMIVATPTGSTGYSLAAGGPILAPTEHHLVVTPVSAHLALSRSIVLLPESEVLLRVTSDHGAVLSIDGQDDIQIESGTSVQLRISPYRTRFVRFREPSSFYADLAQKLDIQISSPINHRA